MGVSGHLLAAADQAAADARSVAAMAMGVRDRVYRRARRGLARRGTCAAVYAVRRRELSIPRPDPVRQLWRDLHHRSRPRFYAAAGGAMARDRRGRPR